MKMKMVKKENGGFDIMTDTGCILAEDISNEDECIVIMSTYEMIWHAGRLNTDPSSIILDIDGCWKKI